MRARILDPYRSEARYQARRLRELLDGERSGLDDDARAEAEELERKFIEASEVGLVDTEGRPF